jgi:hypothetical protein
MGAGTSPALLGADRGEESPFDVKALPGRAVNPKPRLRNFALRVALGPGPAEPPAPPTQERSAPTTAISTPTSAASSATPAALRTKAQGESSRLFNPCLPVCRAAVYAAAGAVRAASPDPPSRTRADRP